MVLMGWHRLHLGLIATSIALSACGRLDFESHQRDSGQGPGYDGGVLVDASRHDGGNDPGVEDAGPPVADAAEGSIDSAAGPVDAGRPPRDGGRDAGPPAFDGGSDAGPPPATNWAFSDDGSNIVSFQGGIYEVSSGSYGSPNNWPRAVDGDPTTTWYVCTNGWMGCIQSVMVIDLGANCLVQTLAHEVSWDGRAQYGTAATIEMAMSPDGSAWTVVDTRSVGQNDRQAIDLSASGISGRYLRFRWTGAVGSTVSPPWNGWGNVREIEAWCISAL